MHIDPNKYYADGTFVQDPTKAINIIPGSTVGNTPFNDPWENPMREIEERIKKEEERKKEELELNSLQNFSEEKCLVPALIINNDLSVKVKKNALN
jgi:hypothetical protein